MRISLRLLSIAAIILTSEFAANAQNVGIGTAAPAQKLEIAGTNNSIRIGGLISTGTYYSSVTGTNSYLVYANGTNGDLYSLPTVNNAILVTSATGVPTWSTSATSGSAWQLTGNSGISSSTNFIGTINNAALIFKTFNALSGTLDPVNHNVYFGTLAGNFAGNSFSDVVIGNQAFIGNTSVGGMYSGGSVVIGDSAEYMGTKDGRGVFIGDGAGFHNNTSADDSYGPSGIVKVNQFIGYQAGYNNTTGVENTFEGFQAGYSNTQAEWNVFFGYQAGYFNSGPGYYATNGFVNNGINNIAFGNQALFGNTTGTDNTAIGSYSVGAGDAPGIYSTGSGNTVVGEANLYTNTTGSNNSSLGLYAIFTNTTGSDNTAMGNQVMATNAGGSFNTAIGEYSLATNANGSSNVAVGENALGTSTVSGQVAVGDSSLINNTTGTGNTAVGYGTLTANVTGINNTAIGYLANVSADYTNATAIGANAVVGESNALVLGNGAKVGIGTNIPAQELEIGGTANTARIDGISHTGAYSVAPSATTDEIMFASTTGDIKAIPNTAGAGSILILNGSGVPTWSTSATAGSAWQLLGNAGTTYGTNFLGTTTDQGIMFKVNSQVAGRIEDATTGNGSYQNTTFGYLANGASSSTNDENVAIGYEALTANTANASNVAVGWEALNALTGSSSAGNVAVGYQALLKATSGGTNTAIGENAMGTTTAAGTGNTALGFGTLNYEAGTGNIGIGVQALRGTGANFTGNYDVAIGYQASYQGITGSYNNLIGYWSDNATVLSGSNNNSLGALTLENLTTGSANVAIGANALIHNTISQSTAVGDSAMAANTSGLANTAIGFQSLSKNQTSGQNTAVGYQTLLLNTAATNTAIGYEALATNTTGSGNTALGYSTSTGASATNSTALGYQANAAGYNNATALGEGATSVAANSITLGTSSAGTLYAPAYSTVGSVFYTSNANGLVSGSGGGTSGAILTLYSSGVPTWSSTAISGSAWQLTGNASTTPGTNYVGTSDANALVFKTDGFEAMRILNGGGSAAGNVGINNATPNSTLSVGGSFAVNVNTAVTSNYTLGATDFVVEGSASSGSFTITLPDATTMKGRMYYVIKGDNSANTITLATTSSQVMGTYASGTLILSNQYEQIDLVSDGSNWMIIGSTKMN